MISLSLLIKCRYHVKPLVRNLVPRVLQSALKWCEIQYLCTDTGNQLATVLLLVSLLRAERHVLVFLYYGINYTLIGYKGSIVDEFVRCAVPICLAQTDISFDQSKQTRGARITLKKLRVIYLL